jgi:hypothetical protein
VSIDGSSISLDPMAEALYYQPPGAVPASGMNLLQTITAYTAAIPIAVAGAPPVPVAGGTWVPQGASETESARQQLDAASRQLVANLDENWRRYLALPAEVYTPGRVPTAQAIQPALARYEDVARRSEYAALHARPEFQTALQSLRRLSEVRTAANSNTSLPPPPGAGGYAAPPR